MTPRNITVGTRGSALALIQTQLLIDALTVDNPHLICEVKLITTKGDVDMSAIPQTAVGKAWFTAEIEQALAHKEIDLAVHSLKDLSPQSTLGSPTLRVVPVLRREDPRDALISKHGELFSQLRTGAVIGTDSARRKALLHTLRPDVVVKSIRGNVQTRLRKMQESEEGQDDVVYDAIVLAAAGLARLDLQGIVTEYFEPSHYIPAVGQGVLAAQVRSDDTELLGQLNALTDPDTVLSVEAEQAFSRAIGGGCKTPVGCYVRIVAGGVELFGMLHNLDSGKTVIKQTTSSREEAVATAEALAEKIMHEANT